MCNILVEVEGKRVGILSLLLVAEYLDDILSYFVVNISYSVCDAFIVGDWRGKTTYTVNSTCVVRSLLNKQSIND